jgi:SAM-dependent methyltransferase
MKDAQSRAALLKIANARLHASITDPNYLVLRRRTQILAHWMDSIPGQRLAVLDVGGRYQPYRPLIEDRASCYIALDVQSTPLVDVVGNGQEIPFKADTFDLAVATQVFAYFREPCQAAAEIHRVLKPGGSLLLSAPAAAPRAGDEEHWRYLPAGLRFILSPFSRIEIVPEVSSIGGTIRLNACALSILSKYDFMREIVHHTLVPILNLLGVAFEGAELTHSDQLTGNYSVLAQK